MPDALRDTVRRNREGAAVSLPSVCSAHPDVLRAALLLAEARDRPVAIEATSNQVNHEGGYTGMDAAAFIAFVHRIADDARVDRARITFGGDHLGPQAWRALPAEEAMDRARVMVAGYVRAGFTKIHLDCSEGCAGEPAQLDDAVTAARSADLAASCRDAAPEPGAISYVIGTEVPPPGGARVDEAGDIPATTPASARATLDAHAGAFTAAGLEDTLAQVAGLVVQPGVEFSPMEVHHLPMTRDPGLRAVAADWPNLCLEAHSTDYQRPEVYVRLAELGFAFQKVGPALTFAFRQAIYALDLLRGIAGWGAPIVQPAMEALMLADPRYWQSHYHGNADDQRLARHVGYADRIRYYWPRPGARAAVAALFADLEGRGLPDPLLLQVFPRALLDRAEALAGPRAGALVTAAIQDALDPYFLPEAA